MHRYRIGIDKHTEQKSDSQHAGVIDPGIRQGYISLGNTQRTIRYHANRQRATIDNAQERQITGARAQEPYTWGVCSGQSIYMSRKVDSA